MVYYWTMKVSHTPKVIYVLRRHIDTKSSKDHVSGVLRYSCEKPDWNLRLVTVPHAGVILSRLLADRPDGIIGIHISDTVSLPKLADVPFVTVDSWGMPLRHHSAVCIDDRAIARSACDLLLRRHFANLAYVGTRDPLHAGHSKAREDEVQDFASRHGQTFAAFTINIGPRSASSIDKLSRSLLSLPLPCGIMAFNDTAAQIVLDSARLANIRVPDQISIVGVDNDTTICENMRPTLTSVLPDFEQSGFMAARLLDEIMTSGNREKRRITYGPRTLIERESTQDTHCSARIATKAQQALRQKCFSESTIANIADELNVSTRFLEMRFKSVFGTTMRAERTSRRLEHAKILLTTTNRPLTDIAASCGSDRFASFAALFRRNVGMTMSTYRKVSQSTG